MKHTTKLLFGASLVASASALAAACADEGTHESPPPDDSTLVMDAGVDGDANADGDSDAAPCTDCEYFLDACEADALCPNGPFDTNTIGGAFDVRTQINVIRGRSPDDVWAAGALGALAHFDGTAWQRSDLGSLESLKALWLRDDGDVSFLRLDYLFTRGLAAPDAGVSDGGWVREDLTTFPPDYESSSIILESGWASTDAQWLWVATRHGAYASPTSGLWRLRRAPDGPFEVGDGLAVGTFSGQMTSVHGVTPDVLWAVGLEGTTVRVSGAQTDTPTFEEFDSRTWDALRGVWVASESEAWSVGAQATIRHWTGDAATWDIVADVPTTEDLNAIWGSSPSDVWAVGNGAVALHFDGATWSRVKIAGLGARRPDLDTVWMAEPGHVWIGGHGVVLSLGGKP